MKDMENALSHLHELADDPTVPRNIREKLQNAIAALTGKSELSIKIDKAMQELDDIGDDSNLQAYTRTQIWNVVSILEKC